MILIVFALVVGAREPYVRLPRKHPRVLAMGGKITLHIDTHPAEITVSGPAELQYSAERHDVPVHVMLNEPGGVQETIDLFTTRNTNGAVNLDAGTHTITIAANEAARGSVTLSVRPVGTVMPAVVKANEPVALPSPTDILPRERKAGEEIATHEYFLVTPQHSLHFSLRDLSQARLYLRSQSEVHLLVHVDGHAIMAALVEPTALPDDYPLDLPPHPHELVLTSDAPLEARLANEP